MNEKDSIEILNDYILLLETFSVPISTRKLQEIKTNLENLMLHSNKQKEQFNSLDNFKTGFARFHEEIGGVYYEDKNIDLYYLYIKKILGI